MTAAALPLSDGPSRAQTNAECRRDAALRDVRDTFYARWSEICADQAAAQADVEKRFWAGDFEKEAG